VAVLFWFDDFEQYAKYQVLAIVLLDLQCICHMHCSAACFKAKIILRMRRVT